MGKDLKGKELGEGLSQRKDGRYSARFRSKSGKRVERYFDKYYEAKKWLADVKYEDQHGNIAASSNMTVDTWFNYWIDERRSIIRDSTYEHYKDSYNSRIKSIIGDMILSDVKPMHCQNVINIAIQSGYKYNTVVITRNLLHTMFESAVENRLMRENPISKSIKCKRPEKPEERRVLTQKEEALFLDVAKKRAHYHHFRFVLQTGLRCGELMGLKWEDVDMERRTLTIQRNLVYVDGEFQIHPPKTRAGYRTIPLTQEAIDTLKDVKNQSKKRVSIQYHDFIFTNKNGYPVSDENYFKSINAIAKKAGIEPLSLHTLRHTFATRCIEAGMNPKTLQKILGHSDLATTMNLYVHVTDDTIQREIAKFENLGVKWA